MWPHIVWWTFVGNSPHTPQWHLNNVEFPSCTASGFFHIKRNKVLRNLGILIMGRIQNRNSLKNINMKLDVPRLWIINLQYYGRLWGKTQQFIQWITLSHGYQDKCIFITHDKFVLRWISASSQLAQVRHVPSLLLSVPHKRAIGWAEVATGVS